MNKTNETTKHTPGPWRVGDAGHTVFGPPTAAISPRTVARIPKLALPCAVAAIDENIANVHLIAAAPELLSALELILESNPELAEVADSARAAIAKAKGEA